MISSLVYDCRQCTKLQKQIARLTAENERLAEEWREVGKRNVLLRIELERRDKMLSALVEAGRSAVAFFLHCDMDGLENASEPERRQLETALDAFEALEGENAAKN